MLNHLSKFINNDVFNGAASTAILLYVYDNKITNTTQLLDRLLNEYLTANVSYGYLYCIDHYTYKIDGTNVYKLGQASNIKKRISSYATYYIKPVELKYASDRIKFYQFAELVLFKKLADCRISPNREFFDCEFDTIKKHIDDIALEFNTCSIIDILNKYEIDTKYINDIKNKIVEFMNKSTILNKILDFNVTHIKKKKKKVNDDINQIKLDDLKEIISSRNLDLHQYLDLIESQKSGFTTQIENHEIQKYKLYDWYRIKPDIDVNIVYEFLKEDAKGNKLKLQEKNWDKFILNLGIKSVKLSELPICDAIVMAKHNILNYLLKVMGFKQGILSTNCITTLDNFKINDKTLNKLRVLFCNDNDIGKFQSKNASAHKLVVYVSRLIYDFYNATIQFDDIQVRDGKKRSYAKSNYILVKSNLIKDYLVLNYYDKNHLLNISYDDTFNYSHIHGFTDCYGDYIKRSIDNYMFLDKNILDS